MRPIAPETTTPAIEGTCADCKKPETILPWAAETAVMFNRHLRARGEKPVGRDEAVLCNSCNEARNARLHAEQGRRLEIARGMFEAMRKLLARAPSRERVEKFLSDVRASEHTRGWFLDEYGDAVRSFERNAEQRRNERGSGKSVPE